MPTPKPLSLSELQRWMRWVLTHPQGVGDALSRPHPLKRYLDVIGETPDVDRETRLSIYGNGYFSRIIEVLEANFASVKNIAGMDAFDGMARDYLIRYPSTFKSIDDIGHRMSAFIAAHPLGKKYPFLPDLAAAEWASHQSFFADDLPVLDAASFKNIPADRWQNARFGLDLSLRLMKLEWPVDDLWRADGKVSRRVLNRLRKTATHLMIYRTIDKFVRMPRISAVRYDLLDQLSKNKTLGQSLLFLVKKHDVDENALPVGDWFQQWITDGIFRRIEFEKNRLPSERRVAELAAR